VKLIIASSILLILALVVPVYATEPSISVSPSKISTDGTVYIHLATKSTGEPDFQYYVVHQIKVICPSGDEYMLGNESHPINMNNAPPNGLDIRVNDGEDIAIPFGTGVGGPITIDGKNYYWWRVKKGGNPVVPEERVDNVPSPNPTGTSGKYHADVEGWALYGESGQEIRLTAWFDIPIPFEVPEFTLPTLTMLSLVFAGYLLYKRRLKPL